VLVGNGEDITRTADRPYGRAGVVLDLELAAKTADQHIETSMARVEWPLKHAFCQVPPAKKDAGSLKKRFQQRKLRVG
jgi:hypothetical protein